MNKQNTTVFKKERGSEEFGRLCWPQGWVGRPSGLATSIPRSHKLTAEPWQCQEQRGQRRPTRLRSAATNYCFSSVPINLCSPQTDTLQGARIHLRSPEGNMWGLYYSCTAFFPVLSLLAVCPREGELTSLRLQFLLCKLGMVYRVGGRIKVFNKDLAHVLNKWLLFLFCFHLGKGLETQN